MSQKRSKRKRSSREEYMLKEQLKIEEGVFDERTMLKIRRLFTHNIISKLEFIIAKGKEADVYIATAGTKIRKPYVAVKIFRIETSNFYKRLDYIRGDPRFEKLKGNIYSMVNEWCKKEFGNLKLAADAKVHAPKPYYFYGNVLALEFLGDEEGTPDSTLKEVGTKYPAKTLEIILEDMKKLYKIGLIHADVSEYNILMKGEAPYLIDFGQAVVSLHPMAESFLRRDVNNILSYFRKNYDIEKDPEETFNIIVKE